MNPKYVIIITHSLDPEGDYSIPTEKVLILILIHSCINVLSQNDKDIHLAHICHDLVSYFACKQGKERMSSFRSYMDSGRCEEGIEKVPSS